MAATDHTTSLRALFELFSDARPVEPPPCEFVSAGELPEPFRRLLAHEDHMTLALEQFHGRPVALRVLAKRHRGDDYARMILLNLAGTDQIVEFGIVRLNLSFCSADVRSEIVSERTPLGRILIEHNVLRRIQPTTFLRFQPNDQLMNWFRIARPEPIFGRLATILVNDVHAIDLLEVVRGAVQTPEV